MYMLNNETNTLCCDDNGNRFADIDGILQPGLVLTSLETIYCAAISQGSITLICYHEKLLQNIYSSKKEITTSRYSLLNECEKILKVSTIEYM